MDDKLLLQFVEQTERQLVYYPLTTVAVVVVIVAAAVEALLEQAEGFGSDCQFELDVAAAAVGDGAEEQKATSPITYISQ